MTIDTIETAREAGFVLEGDLSGAGRLPMLLERFAALVRAQVIEQAAQKCSVLAQERETDYVTNYDCADALRGMKSDSGHSTRAVAEASTAPLPEGKAATARELAAMFRQFTKSSHRWHDGRSVHIVAAEVLEHFAGTGADTARHGSDEQAESASPSVLLIRGEK